VDVPNGFYKFVMAAGDAKFSRDSLVIDVLNGGSTDTVQLISGSTTQAGEYFVVSFDDKTIPACDEATFLPTIESPMIEVTNGTIEFILKGSLGEAPINLLEIYEVEPPLGDLAFAFGIDYKTFEIPNQPGKYYKKIATWKEDYPYSDSIGYGFDTTTLNDGFLSSRDRKSLTCNEIYDQFVSGKNGDLVFRVDVPNGFYKFVMAAGDAKFSRDSLVIDVLNGGSTDTVQLISGSTTQAGEYFVVSFDDKTIPACDEATFLPTIESPMIEVTNGTIEFILKGSLGETPINLLEIIYQVSDIPVTDVSIDQTGPFNLEVGEFQSLTATVTPSTATEQGIVWSSNDVTVVTVNQDGLVTAVGEGSATVTVTTNDGGLTATSSFTVSDPVSVNDVRALDVNIYPNPAKDYLHIKGDNIETIQIVNMQGAIISEIRTPDSNISIDLNGLSSGLYTVKIIKDNNSASTVLVVE
jgi:uncharacterized protein (UPF0248 family)